MTRAPAAPTNGLPERLVDVTALRRLSTVELAEIQGLYPPMVRPVFDETPVKSLTALVEPVLTGFITKAPRPVLVRLKAPVRPSAETAPPAPVVAWSRPRRLKVLPWVTFRKLFAARTYW